MYTWQENCTTDAGERRVEGALQLGDRGVAETATAIESGTGRGSDKDRQYTPTQRPSKQFNIELNKQATRIHIYIQC